MRNHNEDEYIIRQSYVLGELTDIHDLGDYINGDDIILELITDAAASRSRVTREKAIIEIIWYIRSLGLMAGFREGVKRYGEYIDSIELR